MQSDSYQWSAAAGERIYAVFLTSSGSLGTWPPVLAPSTDFKSNSHSFTNPSLKRQHSDLSAPTNSGAKMTSFPPIPKLNGEVLLDVFTHRSLRFNGAPLDSTSEYGDNMRLAVLGDAIMRASVIDTLFRKRPMLTSTQIEV